MRKGWVFKDFLTFTVPEKLLPEPHTIQGNSGAGGPHLVVLTLKPDGHWALLCVPTLWGEPFGMAFLCSYLPEPPLRFWLRIREPAQSQAPRPTCLGQEMPWQDWWGQSALPGPRDATGSQHPSAFPINRLSRDVAWLWLEGHPVSSALDMQGASRHWCRGTPVQPTFHLSGPHLDGVGVRLSANFTFPLRTRKLKNKSEIISFSFLSCP